MPPSSTIVTTKSSIPTPESYRAVRCRCKPKRPQHAGESAQRPGEDEQPELDLLDANAREECRLLTGADREERAPERRRMENDGEDDREHSEECDRVPDVRSGNRNDADVCEVGREAADRVRRQDSLGDAAIERQRPD